MSELTHTNLRAAAQHDPKTMVNTAELRALLADYDALVAAGVKKPKAAAKKAAKKAATDVTEIPDWMPLEAWEAFLAMRQKIKKPATERAKKLIINDLTKFRAVGMDPEAVLDQSTRKSWQDVYELKAEQRGATVARRDVRNFRAEQQQQANQEALDRLNGVPMFDPTVIDVEAAYVAD